MHSLGASLKSRERADDGERGRNDMIVSQTRSNWECITKSIQINTLESSLFKSLLKFHFMFSSYITITVFNAYSFGNQNLQDKVDTKEVKTYSQTFPQTSHSKIISRIKNCSTFPKAQKGFHSLVRR